MRAPSRPTLLQALHRRGLSARCITVQGSAGVALFTMVLYGPGRDRIAIPQTFERLPIDVQLIREFCTEGGDTRIVGRDCELPAVRLDRFERIAIAIVSDRFRK
jgi:hypothetical protein